MGFITDPEFSLEFFSRIVTLSTDPKYCTDLVTLSTDLVGEEEGENSESDLEQQDDDDSCDVLWRDRREE